MARSVPASVSKRRARVAGLVSKQAPAEVIEDARRDLKAAVAEEHIKRIVDGFPPLTDSQRAKLAALFTPTPSVEGADAA